MNDNIINDKFKVLVVDDESSVRFLLTQMLEGEGYEVIEASDGESAIEIFKSEAPDMILIDAMMPILDGMSTCRMLRRLDTGKNVPVLMITGLDDDSVVDMAFESGVSDFITKPFQFSVLRQRVKRMLRLKTAESMLEEKLVNERSITELVNDGIIITDAGNQIISFNPSAEDIFNFKAADIIGRKISEIIPELTDEAIKRDSEAAGENKNIKIKKETAGKKRDRTQIPIGLTLNGLDSGNKLISVHDLTEKKQTQSTIKMAEMVFENIREAICVIDSGCIVQFTNPAFCALSGYSEQQTIGQSIKLIMPDVRAQAAFDEIISHIKAGEQKQAEFILST
ncbi:MAG TPA: response regulator, partial [Candidatus Wallbacteria bacterium]|nr:response regulator [Candidatus Wallbacteria bacterium]